MLPLLLLPAALAGWTAAATVDGCTIYQGDLEGDALPLRAVCDWDRKPAELHAILRDQARQADVFESLRQSVPLQSSVAGVERAYQVHGIAGLPEKEVVLQLRREEIPGGWRYSWQKDPDQSEVTRDSAEIERFEGSWEVTETASGGVHLVYESRFAPGGRLPAGVVHKAQLARLKQILDELRLAEAR